MTHRLVIAIAIALSLFCPVSRAFYDPPYITPAHPVVGDVVSVNIYGGICDSLFVGLVPPRLTQDGNALRVLFWSVHYTDFEWCNLGVGTLTYPLGSFAPGFYTVQVDRFDHLLLSGEPDPETLGTVSFTVTRGTPPASAPALGTAGTGILLLALSGFAWWSLRRRCARGLIVALCVLPIGARAADMRSHRVIELLVTTAPGAPTAEQIVAWFAHPEGPPPLEGLAVETPETAQYLMSRRAEGEFLDHLHEHPDTARARLERYVLVVYPEGADLPRALQALRTDPYVARANEPIAMDFLSAALTQFVVETEDPQTSGGYWRDALNIDAAWAIAGGYALVADIDSGLYVNHPALRQFSGSQYAGGNFVAVDSLDVSGRGAPNLPDDANVDEREPMLISNPVCSPGGPSLMSSILAGHGTHTAGLIAASNSTGLDAQGSCKHCGIAMWKVAYTECATSGDVVLAYNPAANATALGFVGDGGAQVASMSFGGVAPAHLCDSPTISDPDKVAMCDAIEHAIFRDVAMVAAAGNDRTALDFPANDERVIAAGGFQSDLALWDDAPGTTIGCPYPYGGECGSNYTKPASGPKQELIGAAKSVVSTTYPGFDWNPRVRCGDGFPGPGWGNGTGWCTGTSMSTPQIAGVVGLLRSINPLVPVGKPTFNPNIDAAATLRYVLASTTFQAQAGQPWTSRLGYGRPDAAAAARKMLGKVAGVTIRNRATPLFRLYSSSAKDYADTTSPQTAFALMFNQKSGWQPAANAAPVPGYPQFPHDPAEGAFAAPRAAVYVMTTEAKPRAEWPSLIPLYLMDRTSPSRDFLLVTTTAHIEQAHAAGYALRTIQATSTSRARPSRIACRPDRRSSGARARPRTTIAWRSSRASGPRSKRTDTRLRFPAAASCSAMRIPRRTPITTDCRTDSNTWSAPARRARIPTTTPRRTPPSCR